MRPILAAAILAAGGLAVPAGAQAPGAGLAMPQQPQIINLNLLEALVAVKEQELAGVFAYIPEGSAPAAFADFLLHHKPALKRFIKKAERDFKEIGCISEWDKQVFLFALGLHSSGILREETSNKIEPWIPRISALSIAPAMPLSEMTLRRKPE